MNSEYTLLTPDERKELDLTVLASHLPEEQYADLDQQQETSALGMWVFLATEVMFFGTLFLGLGVYRCRVAVGLGTRPTRPSRMASKTRSSLAIRASWSA